MTTDKYGLHTIDYGVTGWDSIMTTDMERIDDFIPTRLLVTLGETVSAKDALYLNVNGKYYKALANGIRQPALGLAVEGGNLNDSIRLQIMGETTASGWAWTTASGLYLSPTVSGGLTHTEPDDFSQFVAYATSASTILIGPTLTTVSGASATTLAIADGGTGETTAQAAIDALTNVSAATDEYVLTKDTSTGNAVFKEVPTAAVSDGDKGDITVSSAGTQWDIDNTAVTYAKIQDTTTTDIVLGRSTTGGGMLEEITCTSVGRDLLALTDADGAVSDGDKGDITVSSAGTQWDIDNGVVTYAKIQDVSATDMLLGRVSTGAGSIEEVGCTSFGRDVLACVDAAALLTLLGL